MKLDIESTFEEFSNELSKKVLAVKVLHAASNRKTQEELFTLRRDAFKVATQCFPEEVRALLHKHELVRKYSALVSKAEIHLRKNQIQYNIFDDLFVLQIITPTSTTHERFLFTEDLMREYMEITPGASHYHLLAGFCEDPKVNETLQLIFYLVTGADAN